jgi:hypothetical protein
MARPMISLAFVSEFRLGFDALYQTMPHRQFPSIFSGLRLFRTDPANLSKLSVVLNKS